LIDKLYDRNIDITHSHTRTPERIFTQNTSNDVVPGKKVPFEGPDDYILYSDS